MGKTEQAYWVRQGYGYKARFEHHPPEEKLHYRQQEEALLKLLRTLHFSSVIEFGCGFGRMTALVAGEFHPKPYVAFDVSGDQVAFLKGLPVEAEIATIEDFYPAEKADLVLGSEVLLHVPPSEVGTALKKICSWSKAHVVTLDQHPQPPSPYYHYYTTEAKTISSSRLPFNYYHDYRGLYRWAGMRVERYQINGRCALFHAEHA